MNLDTGTLKPADRAGVRDCETEGALGHLHGVDPAQHEAQQGSGAKLGEQEGGDEERARGARRDAGQTRDRDASPRSAERCHEHPVDGARGLDGRDSRGRGIHGFNIDVEARGGKLRERLGERTEAFAATEINRGELCGSEIANAPRPPRDAIENVIVAHDRHTVARRVHVGLEVSQPELNGGAKSGESVFGCANGKSPVREDSRPGTCQIRLRRQRSAPSA